MAKVQYEVTKRFVAGKKSFEVGDEVTAEEGKDGANLKLVNNSKPKQASKPKQEQKYSKE